MNDLIVAFDIDGTLTDPYFLLEKINKGYNLNLQPEDYNQPSLSAVCGFEIDWSKEIDGLSLFEWYVHSPVDFKKIQLIKDLTKNNIGVIIVTARGDEGFKHAKEMLSSIGLSDIPIFQSSRTETKGQILTKQKARVMIEDSLGETIEIAKSGIEVLLLERFYNKGEKLEGASYVKDSELRNRLEGMLGCSLDKWVDFHAIECNMHESCLQHPGCVGCRHRKLCTKLGIQRVTFGTKFVLSDEYERCKKIMRMIEKGAE